LPAFGRCRITRREPAAVGRDAGVPAETPACIRRSVNEAVGVAGRTRIGRFEPGTRDRWSRRRTAAAAASQAGNDQHLSVPITVLFLQARAASIPFVLSDQFAVETVDLPESLRAYYASRPFPVGIVDVTVCAFAGGCDHPVLGVIAAVAGAAKRVVKDQITDGIVTNSRSASGASRSAGHAQSVGLARFGRIPVLRIESGDAQTVAPSIVAEALRGHVGRQLAAAILLRL